jgi:hypothetical protein
MQGSFVTGEIPALYSNFCERRAPIPYISWVTYLHQHIHLVNKTHDVERLQNMTAHQQITKVAIQGVAIDKDAALAPPNIHLQAAP